MSIKNKFALPLLIASSAFFFASCQQASVDTVNSNTVESAQVYQQYFITATRGQSSVAATFRVGGATGTTVELSQPGKVTYNGAPLDKSAPSNFIGTDYRVKGTDYRKSTDNYQANHEFLYTDAGGKTYRNSIALPPLEIGAKIISINRKTVSKIPLSRALGAGETIKLLIGYSTIEPIPDQYKTIYLAPERNALIITPKFWQSHSATGETSVGLKVKKTSSISQGTPLGGLMTVEYESSTVNANIINTPKAAANSNAVMQPSEATTQNNTAANLASNQTSNSNLSSNTNSSLPQPTKKKRSNTRRKIAGGRN